MTRLHRAARETLRAYGYSEATWSFYWTGDRSWRGDACGCTDDRCVGYHHDVDEHCGCLPALLVDPYYNSSAPRPGDQVEVWTGPGDYIRGVVDGVAGTQVSVRGTGKYRGHGKVTQAVHVYVVRRGFHQRA